MWSACFFSFFWFIPYKSVSWIMSVSAFWSVTYSFLDLIHPMCVSPLFFYFAVACFNFSLSMWKYVLLVFSLRWCLNLSSKSCFLWRFIWFWLFFLLGFAKLCFFLLNGLQICTSQSSRSSKKRHFCSDPMFYFSLLRHGFLCSVMNTNLYALSYSWLWLHCNGVDLRL